MTDELYLSRARVRRDASAEALRPLLVPKKEDARYLAAHALVWSLFADSSARTRDFLWREAEPGLFFLLSRRKPLDARGLFDLDEPKPFEPSFRVGDRLRFSLRANATVARNEHAGRGKRSDVVMHAIYSVSPGERASARREAVTGAGLAWLQRQGERGGFDLGSDTTVDSYRTLVLERSREGAARLGILDFEGTLSVRDPVRFLGAIAEGFGRGKAFGCGLMLIRRP